MELINDLKTDWKFKNARIMEWNADNPLMPITLYAPNENEFEKWVDVVDQEDYALMYTPETATDFTGIYYTYEFMFEWCNEYEVDRSKPMIYGVADNVGQVLEYLKDYESEIGKCIININPIYKKINLKMMGGDGISGVHILVILNHNMNISMMKKILNQYYVLK